MSTLQSASTEHKPERAIEEGHTDPNELKYSFRSGRCVAQSGDYRIEVPSNLKSAEILIDVDRSLTKQDQIARKWRKGNQTLRSLLDSTVEIGQGNWMISRRNARKSLITSSSIMVYEAIVGLQYPSTTASGPAILGEINKETRLYNDHRGGAAPSSYKKRWELGSYISPLTETYASQIVKRFETAIEEFAVELSGPKLELELHESMIRWEEEDRQEEIAALERFDNQMGDICSKFEEMIRESQASRSTTDKQALVE